MCSKMRGQEAGMKKDIKRLQGHFHRINYEKLADNMEYGRNIMNEDQYKY